MNEEQIALLKSLGFKVNEFGGILDESGNFHESVNYEGNIIESFQSRDEYNDMISRQKELESIGFESSAESENNLETQQNIALAKNKLKQYQDNPESIDTPDWTDPYTKAAFDELQIENQEQLGASYPNGERMQEAVEEGTIYEDIDNPEDKNRLKQVNNEINKIEELDADVDTIMEGILTEERDPNRNIFEKGGDLLWDGIYSLVKAFTPTGTGMDDKKLKEKYLNLKSERKSILIPVANKKLQETQSLLEQLKQEREETDFFSIDNDKYAYAITKLEVQENNLKDFISGDNLDSNIFSSNNAADWASLGIYDAIATYAYDAKLRDKIEKGEELSSSDKAIAMANVAVGDVQKQGFEQNFWHQVSGGTNESLKFLAYGGLGRSAGKGLSKIVGRNLSGTSNLIVGTSGNLATQAALHPHTYQYAFDKYAGDFEMRLGPDGEVEVLAGKRLYNTLKTENELFKADMEEQLEIAKANGNEKEITKYKNALDKAEAYDKHLKEPVGYGDALIYGFTEVLKENLAEQYGGKLYGAIGLKKIENIASNSKLGKAVFNNKITRGINDMSSYGKDILNKNFGGVPGSKLIGSNTEEIFEEILVQATPSYGQSWDEYQEQVSELGKLDFYAKVAAQTMLMQKTFQAGGIAKKYYDIQKLSSDEKQKRKELGDLYKELGNRNLSQSQFDEAMMKAGEGNFSIQEYTNTINKLRKEGKLQEANEIEQNKIYNQAVIAQKYGKLPEFQKSLTKAKYNKNLSPETLGVIEKVKIEVNEMINDNNQYINSNEVINLKSKRRYTQKTIDEIEKQKNNLNHSKINDEIDSILTKLGIEDSYATIDNQNPIMNEYFDKNFHKLSSDLQTYLSLKNQEKEVTTALQSLDKQLKKITSYDHQTYLMNEESYLGYLNGLNKKIFKRNVTSEQFKTLIPKIPKSKQKGINEKRINELHQQIISTLEFQEKANQINTSNQDVNNQQPETQTNESVTENEPLEEQPSTPVQQQTQNVLQNVVMNTAEQLAQEENLSDPFDTENEITIQNNDTIDFLPSDGMSNQFKEWFEIYHQENGSKANFEDFYTEALESVDNDKSAFNKSILKYMGENWEAAGLGKSNWEKVYKDNYTSLSSVTRNIVNQILGKTDVIEDAVKPEQVNTVSETTQIKKVEPASGINPLTGEAVKITPVVGKTLVTTPKANYAALKYVNKREVSEIDGKKVIVYTKKDTNEIPVLNEESFVDIKALLHPNKNNPGDTWNINVSNESDWGDENLKVSVNNPNTGETSEYISFSEWIKKNQPQEMSLEEFQKTDAYISKVPIYYSDNQGNKVAFVADVDWYNPLSVRDSSKEADEFVELNNLTDNHKQKIQEGKDNTLELRKNIIEGKIKEVQIVSKEGSPFITIPKNDINGNPVQPKTLKEAAPDNKLVFFKGDYFVDLDGNPLNLDDIEITNLDDIKKQSKKGITHATFYLSPVNKTESKQRFIALNVLRRNEQNQNQAMSEDIQTAKWIMAANAVLNKNKAGYNLTLDQAENIRNQIKQVANIDIINFDNTINLVNSLIALQKGNQKYSANSKGIPLPNGKTGYFIDALFFGDYTPVQNTNLNIAKSVGLSVVQKGNIFEIKKIGENYEDFLKQRLTTNIISYNMGTEENPAYTASVQPIIKVEPIETEIQTTLLSPQEVSTQDGASQILAANEFLKSINGYDNLDDFDYLLPTLEEVNKIKESLNVIPGLTIDQQQDVINYVLSSISSKYDLSKELSIIDFNKEIQKGFNNHFNTLKNQLEEHYKNLNGIYQTNPEKNAKMQPVIDVIQKNINRVNKVIDNYDKFFTKSYLEGMRKGFIPSTVKTDNELQNEINTHFEDEMYQKDYNKSSNEIIHKDKISKKLRRLFSTITNNETGFLGLPKHESYDMMYNTISTILISPLPASPSFDVMMKRLDMFNDTYPWLKPLTDKLKKSEDDVKNSFVSNMYKYAAKAKFVAFTDQTGGMESMLWFSNANNIKQKIKESWNNNFKRSNITNGNTINTQKLQALYEQWESWGENKHLQPQEVLTQWLADFGIHLSDGSWKNLQDGKLMVGRGKKARPMSFEQLFFDTGKRSDRLFSNLANYAKENMNKKQGSLDFVQNNKVHPFNDMNNIFKSLIDIEVKHNTSLINITRRDGDKTVSEIIFPSFFLNGVNKLISSSLSDDKTYIKDLKKLSFSSNSHVLDLLLNNPEFAEIFEYGETGLMSMKKLYNKNPKFSKIEQLSPIDYMFHQRAMFQYMQTENLKLDKNGFPLRVATMSTPTNSDKGRMMLIKTATFDLFSSANAFKKNAEDNFEFSKEVKELLYETMIVPELKRILNHQSTNIKDYDKGAIRFNLIPQINTLLSSDNVSVLEFLKNNNNEEEFKNKFFDNITSYLEKSIKEEADSNLELISDFVKKESDNSSTDLFNNKDYLSQRKEGSVEEKMLLAEYDYIINSMIANMNTLQLIAGDPAMYYKSKGVPTSIDTNEQIQISRDLGTNLGKRLALMIAPGVVLSNSQDETYLQLFLKDQEEVAANAEEIIGWHYGKQSLNEEFNDKTYQEHINDLRNKNISKDNLNQLQLRFSKVKDFLTIESTDAQEYTTLKEHLRVLEGLGRLSLEKKNEILKTVYEDKKPLSKNDIELVLQPIKPVYTGDIIDTNQDVKRIMYVKSSSFPLIPDLVNGTPLQSLMNKMEEIENTQNINVRASYQSANKVGAMKNSIDPFNNESLSQLDELNTETGRPLHAIELNRIDFKIQQDVPFKSDLQKEDKVSMGTQIFKLLFGDGITDISGFRYNGKELNGKELQQEFFKTFSSIVGIQKNTLLDELGLDDDYTSDNPLETAKKLQSLLVAEAEERGFSENDIKALEIEKKNIGNKEVYHFKLPLWFSGNSNKFESMLNAIINNRVLKQKLPGNSFVVGSEAGIKLSENKEQVGNNIVFIGDYKGGELKGNEVLAPSKFKMDGKLIDLFDKNDNGEYKYLNVEKNGFTINQEVIDPVLFENFTFRTPTSSHGSGSSIKIVGFIPSVMGDLMITPKNFVAQMGQDFDIDKLTNYQYHTVIMPDGKIKILDETNRKEFITKNVQLIRELREQIKAETEYGDNVNKLIKSIFDIEVDNDIIENLEDNIKQIKSKLNQKFDLKIAQNNFIKIHNSVYNNKSAEVQKKINKVLSMEFAEKQADAIDTMNNSNDTAAFNILSPSYQMNKMIAGSTGAAAIGIYAKGVTFNSMAQQSDKPIQLLELDENLELTNTVIRIGDVVSNGTFGLRKTLYKSNANPIEKELVRNTTEVQDERVNTATDNEKAQILGRVGINDLDAVAVDNLLSLLGIDAEINTISKDKYDESNSFHRKAILNGEEVYYTEYSLPYLLHSQPIVKEYFNRLKNGKAIIQDFTANAEEKILSELIGEYVPQSDFNTNFTGENLINEIKANNINNDFQKEILLLYNKLIQDSKKLKNLQDIIDMSNLGKSMWELKDKIEKFTTLPDNTDFLNAESLIGTFDTEQGELDLGGVFFTPTTNQGVMIGTALSLGRNLFFDYFPYYDGYIDKKINEVISQSGFKGNEVEFKENIFQEIKKYITSATRNNLFLDTPNNERQAIFMDTDDNVSLSTYIANLFNDTNEEFNTGINNVKNNAFLSYLSYEKGEEGKPSLIKFDNTEIANVSEEHFHSAFKELFVKDIPLPSRNGNAYSTRQLAQELVAYSHLSGGIVREAIEFHRFIPIEYYDELYNTDLNVNVTRMLQNYDTLISNWQDKSRLKNFNEQFFQNNPEFAVQFPIQFRKEFVRFKDNNMWINTEMDEYPQYVSVKNKTKDKLKQSKWSLYKLRNGNQYSKIDVLGEFGMSEYDYDNNNMTSIIVKPVSTVEPVILEQTVKNIPPIGPELKGFNISNTDTAKDILEKVRDNNITYNPNLSNVAGTLLDIFQDQVLTTNVKVVNDNSLPFRGRHKNGTITMNMANRSKMAETFIHEFIHGVTVNELKQYYNKDWTEVLDNAPKEVIQLNILFQEYKNKIQKLYPQEFATFVQKFNDYKNNVSTSFTDRELSVFYPTVNIKEFIAVSLSNNQDFIAETSKIPYKKSGMKITEKFIKVLDALLNKFAGVSNNLAEQILGTSLATIEVLNKKTKEQEVSPQEMQEFKHIIKQDDIFISPDEQFDDSNIDFSQDIDGEPDVSLLPDNIKKCK
jgi:hypothetical protein